MFFTPTEPVLYAMLMTQANGLAATAIMREQTGAKSDHLRGYYEQRAGLSWEQNKRVFEAAVEYSARAAELDAEAKQVIGKFHAAQAANPSGGATPFQELKGIKMRREALLMQVRSDLQSELGEDGFNRIEIYIHSVFGQMRGRKAAPSAPGTDSGGGQ